MEKQDFKRIFNTLPAYEKEILLMRYNDNMSLRRISYALNLSGRPEVKKLLEKIENKLKSMYNP